VRYVEWMGTRRAKVCKYSTNVRSAYYGNLPPTATAATQMMELGRQENNESGEDVNNAKDKPDGKFLCRLQNYRCEAYKCHQMPTGTHTILPSYRSVRGGNPKKTCAKAQELESDVGKDYARTEMDMLKSMKMYDLCGFNEDQD
jgi:hypothetical protein